MANIVLKTFAAGDEGQGTVTPQDDSLIYQNAVSVNGIFGGATVTLTGANTLHVASGFGVICGRFFEINESDISVQLSSSGTLNGRLKIHLDLNNADNPIEIVTETGATLPALSGDSNININGGAFDMELCTFTVNELTISSLVNTFPTIDNTSKQIRRKTAYAVNDFVLCQSASDAFIFICTTAGTTAVQEPTGYTTITDGNTITDGTAVFKAVSVSGQITKLSKTEDLIAYVQTSLIASKAYAIGEQFIYGGKLYTTTSAIAEGGTIVIGTNASLSAEIVKQIKSAKDAIGTLNSLTTTDKSSTVGAINEVDSKADNAQQMIAPIESGATASQSYAVGEQFILNGLLSKAKTAITQDDSFVLDGNYELADSVTEQIKNLNTDVTSRIKRFASTFINVTSSKKLNITRNNLRDAYFVILRGGNANTHYTALINGYGGGSARNAISELSKGVYITSAEFKTPEDPTDFTFEISFSTGVANDITIVVCSLYSDASDYTVTLI